MGCPRISGDTARSHLQRVPKPRPAAVGIPADMRGTRINSKMVFLWAEKPARKLGTPSLKTTATETARSVPSPVEKEPWLRNGWGETEQAYHQRPGIRYRDEEQAGPFPFPKADFDALLAAVEPR